jgi:hypothetical protein
MFSNQAQAQHNWLVYGGVEYSNANYLRHMHYKTLGANYQYKFAKRFVIGTGMNFKVMIVDLPPAFSARTNLTGLGLQDRPDKISMVISPGTPTVVFSQKASTNTQFELPLFLGIQLNHPSKLPLLLKIGMGNNFVQYFEFIVGEKKDISLVYTANTQLGLQIPLYRARKFALSVEPYTTRIKPVNQAFDEFNTVQDFPWEYQFGMRLKAHLYK